MDKFAGLAAFLRTAQTQSFVAAGRQLGVSASAVGKSVARLEERLGVRLFQRSTRRIHLTEEGRLYYQRCQHLLSDVDDAEEQLSRATEAPRGRLRISVITMGYRFLIPVLAEFMRRYPEIELDLDFDDRIVDVIDDGFDAVIRSGDLPDSRFIARALGSFQTGLFASPEYVHRHGTPRNPGDLERHCCVQFRNHASGKLQKWAMRVDRGETEPQLPISMVCNNIEALLAAAVHGMGIAYMPTFLARDAVASNSLVPLLEHHQLPQGQLYLLWPSARQMTPKLRVFVDFLCDRLSLS